MSIELSPLAVDVIGLVIQALGVLATLAAVAVALYLGLNQFTPSVEVTRGIYNVISTGMKLSEGPRIFSLTATNIGPVPARIEGVSWTVGRWKKAHAVMLTPGVPTSKPIPTVLGLGESVQVNPPFEMFAKNLAPVLKMIEDCWFPSLALRNTRIGFYGPGRQFFNRSLDESLLKHFRAELGRRKTERDQTK